MKKEIYDEMVVAVMSRFVNAFMKVCACDECRRDALALVEAMQKLAPPELVAFSLLALLPPDVSARFAMAWRAFSALRVLRDRAEQEFARAHVAAVAAAAAKAGAP